LLDKQYQILAVGPLSSNLYTYNFKQTNLIVAGHCATV
jgi:hypothetical protein